VQGVGDEWLTAAAGTRHVGRDEVTSAVSCGKAAVMAGSARLSRVFLVIGFKGEDEGICTMRISGEGIEPTHHPCAECKSGVDPILRVVEFFFA